MEREIKFSLVYRDMYQSSGKFQPLAEQLEKIAPAIIEMGCFARVETNGGAFEQVNLMAGENPNKAVRRFTKPFNEAGIQTHMLDRALNALRMFPVPADVRRMMYKVKKAQGVDITRIFCGLNDTRNIIPSIKYALEAGMIPQATLCITSSPIHTVEYYSGIADELIDWEKENGYNYIEIMPLGEHSCDESWGYQGTGFFAPTSRYGTAVQLMNLVDKCHQKGIGVIMDFVPVHFAIDGYALAEYDGTALYEYPNIDIGISQWGSKNFNHSRGEVQSFLQSCACYWLKEFHFDGIRIDALSNIIYWHGNKDRGVNERAVEFIKYMNETLKKLDSSIMLMAEDSTSFEGVTRSVEEHGLGFDYKWDMGWMNDTLQYFSIDPIYRKYDHHKLTFSMMYFYSERFLMPLSHDENVHGTHGT